MRISIAGLLKRLFIAILLLIGIDAALASAIPGYIYTVAGTGVVGYSGDNSAATKATLAYPRGVAADTSGNLYIADFFNSSIRKVAPNGTISTVAGTGKAGSTGDAGLANKALLNSPCGVAVDSVGRIYIADSNNNRIRMVAPTGIITTVVGAASGIAGYSGDGGSAVSAQLNYPLGVALDSQGNIYIADTGNNVIRKVTVSSGIISTVAGSSGVSGFIDNVTATSGTLSAPNGVAVDRVGNLYIADSGNNVIRMVTPPVAPAVSGFISTVAGNGIGGYAGDNDLATSAELAYPKGVAVDGAGNLYIADFYNQRIREVAAINGIVTANSTITTLTGTGVAGYSGDSGFSTLATLYYPNGVAVDGSGNLYVADYGNNAVRMVPNALSQTIGNISFSPNTLVVSGATTVSATDTSGLALSFSSLTPGICTVSDRTVTGVASGTCTVAANQAGSANYHAATQMTQSITVATGSRSDCIFNWAERTYPQYFAPAGATSERFPPYYYRYYSGTGNYLATSLANSHLWALGQVTGNSLLDLGPDTDYLGASGCP